MVYPRIFFGDKHLSVDPQQIDKKELYHPKDPNIPLILQNQVHGTDGHYIQSDNRRIIESGDYLVSNERNISIGILTADCLPIIYIDPQNHAFGIAHAGWKGTVKEIAVVVIDRMTALFGSKANELELYFGPSARPCCYTVNDDFINNLPSRPVRDKAVVKREEAVFFDLPRYNLELLINLGIHSSQIDMSQNACTICNPQFCSYRREMGSPIRQISSVGLY